MATKTELSGGSIWVGLRFMLTIGGIIWFGLYTGLILNSLFGVFLTLILSLMLIVGYYSSAKVDLVQDSSYALNSVSFILGLIIFLVIGSLGGAQSVFSLPTNQLYSTIAGELPQELDFLVNSIVIPHAEEIFWNLGILGTTFYVLQYAGRRNKLFANPFVQIFILVLIGGTTFAVFHVLKLVTAFLIAAFIFRSIATVLVYGDGKYNWIPYLQVTFAFAIGMHVGNNWGDYGFLAGLQILFSNFVTFGWIVLGVIVSDLLIAINYFAEKFTS